MAAGGTDKRNGRLDGALREHPGEKKQKMDGRTGGEGGPQRLTVTQRTTAETSKQEGNHTAPGCWKPTCHRNETPPRLQPPEVAINASRLHWPLLHAAAHDAFTVGLSGGN